MKTVFICFLILAASNGYSQSDSNRSLSIGYFGETISHPGLSIGLEKTLVKTDPVESILSTEFGGYLHYRNNLSLFLRLKWGQRYFFKNGLFIEQQIGLGYLHQFVHGGDKFDVLPNGAVVELRKTGRSKFMPSVAIGTGYRLKNSGHVIYFRPEVFWKAPFNGYYLTHLAVSAGLIVKF